jgi:hypothetical protein
VELDIIKLFGFTFKDGIKDNILEWNENFVQDHFNWCLENWKKFFANGFKLRKMMKRFLHN